MAFGVNSLFQINDAERHKHVVVTSDSEQLKHEHNYTNHISILANTCVVLRFCAWIIWNLASVYFSELDVTFLKPDSI